MATLEEQRRSSGSAMESNRRNIGATNESNRRAGGSAMIERRTGKSLVSDLNRLAEPSLPGRVLPPIEPVGALPASRGRGVYQPPPATGSAGIASPLVEEDSTRAYYPDRLIASVDGAVFFSVRRTKTVTMRDANDALVVLELDDAPT